MKFIFSLGLVLCSVLLVPIGIVQQSSSNVASTSASENYFFSGDFPESTQTMSLNSTPYFSNYNMVGYDLRNKTISYEYCDINLYEQKESIADVQSLTYSSSSVFNSDTNYYSSDHKSRSLDKIIIIQLRENYEGIK